MLINYKKILIQILLLFIFLFKQIVSYENYYDVKICSPETCPYPSLCVSKTTCQCKKGFYNTNLNSKDYSNKCKYKMKSSSTPFWVEAITNIGIGHMLIGDYKVGIFKLFYMISTLCFFYFVCMSDTNSKKYLVDGYHLIISIINLLMCLGVFIWWLVDTICFGINKYKDNNGIELSNY